MAAVMLGRNIALSGVSCAVPTQTSAQPWQESCARASFGGAAALPCRSGWRIGASERSAVRWAVRAALKELSVDNDALALVSSLAFFGTGRQMFHYFISKNGS
jgi:hypothetical protein